MTKNRLQPTECYATYVDKIMVNSDVSCSNSSNSSNSSNE